MAYTNWNVTKFAIWAVVEGTEIEVIECQINHGINTIPRCTLSVAIGRDVSTLIPAAIHSIIDDLTIQVPAQVYAQVIEADSSFGASGPVDEWPADPFLLFDGYIVGTGFGKSRSGGAQLRLSLIHWLADLNFSSVISRATAPFNPAQFNLQAAFGIGKGVQPNFQASTGAGNFINAISIASDFWGECLQPWFLAICQKNMLSVDEDPVTDGNNVEAVAALQRIEPLDIAPAGEEPMPGYIYGVPLSMDAFSVLGIGTAIESIIEDISQETYESMASTTIWDKIINQLAPNYKFSLVPLTDTALIVPFTPGMQSAWTIIDGSQYEAIDLQGDIPRAIRGLAIFTGLGSMTGANGLQKGAANAIQELGGYYENPDIDNNQGMVLFRQGPKWIVNTIATSPWAVFAAAPNGIKCNAMFPDVAVVNAPFPAPRQIREESLTLWNAYAHACYLNEVLKGRSGTIRGKIRFDISPGSTVAILCTEEKFVTEDLGTPGDTIIFGEVLNVTTMINSESCSGHTMYKIGFLRSEEENILEGTSTPSHPLYSVPWFGAPLVEEPEFDHPAEATQQGEEDGAG